MKRPAFFFDRDGVINQPPGDGYVTRPEDFFLMPGARELLAEVKARGFFTVLITNQQGVGKGKMSLADLSAVHERMQDLLGPEAALDAIYFCPHLAGACDCRKPSPKMVLDAASDWGLDLSSSWLIGDHDRDMETGRSAGVGTLVRFQGEKAVRDAGDHLVRRLDEVRELLKLHA